MADLRIVDAPEIPTNSITGQEKLPTGGSGNYSISLDSLADYTKTKKDLVNTTTVDGKVNGVRQELNTHIEDLLNPHQVTKGQIGLGNVDNTSDADKPVSNSTQAAIISAVSPKADKTYVDTALSSKTDKTYVDTALSSKTDKTYVDTALSSKTDKTYVDNQLSLKANKADVYTKQESSDLVSNSISTALTPINTSLDLAKRGIANRYDSSLTYNLGERVVLTNGDIVKSTIDGNTNNPNVNMTGWRYSSLTPSNNLSDVADKAAALANLGVYSKAETDGIAATPSATEAVAGKAKIATTAIAQAGTNDTDFITALKLANTRQSVWVNKTGMLFGTTYMNTALYEKEISFISGLASGLLLTAKVTFKNLTTNIETIVYFGSVSNWTGGIASSANFTVPPNTSFKIEIVSTDSLSTVVTLAVAQWSERYYV